MNCRSARAARSLLSEYSIFEGGSIYIRPSTAEAHAVVQEQRLSIQALSGKGVANLEVLPPSDPDLRRCCAIFVVSSNLTVLLDVSDRISDRDDEIQKLELRVKKSRDDVAKQEELMARDGFDKVSDVVHAAEEKKLEDARTVVRNIEKTIEQFRKLEL
jgi:valyl-tRNA synthetase